jgi:hypothetical protein
VKQFMHVTNIDTLKSQKITLFVGRSMAKGRHEPGKHKKVKPAKPAPGDPDYDPAKGGCGIFMLGPLIVIAGLILAVVGLSGCNTEKYPSPPLPTPTYYESPAIRELR